jgi:hypothetical protein
VILDQDAFQLREAFRHQAAVCAEMGSPFTSALCALMADRLEPGDPVSDRVLGWPGDPSNRADALPLRLAGALHALVLDRRDANLVAAYPPALPDMEILWRTVTAAFAAHREFILCRLDGPPQTNETQRSAALCPGFLTVVAQTGLPLVCSEVGASAGLNLLWDRFSYSFGSTLWGDATSPVRLAPEWRGPPPPVRPAVVVGRAGCDVTPLDPADPDAEARLLSFVWADQAERLDRLRAAVALARKHGVAVVRADAADWLAGRLAVPYPGQVHVVSHSIMWQYMPRGTQDRIAMLLADAGARATPEAPLAWLRLEPDGDAPGAAVTLDLWPGGTQCLLARADFHGRWVEWRGR